MKPVVIVGGGISGLSTAYYLGKAGVASIIIEPRDYLGGVIRTEHVDGCVLEQGPDSFISIKPAAVELIKEVGMGDDVIGSNDHSRKTYLKKNGRLIVMPDGLMMMVPTKIVPVALSPLLGIGTKLRTTQIGPRPLGFTSSPSKMPARGAMKGGLLPNSPGVMVKRGEGSPSK